MYRSLLKGSGEDLSISIGKARQQAACLIEYKSLLKGEGGSIYSLKVSLVFPLLLPLKSNAPL